MSTRAANEAGKELRELNGPVHYSDYVVDLCFMTYVPGGLGADHAAGVGIRAGMVGRKQRRFIVNLEVPPAMTDRQSCRMWIGVALTAAAALVRDLLPRKGKTYPVDRLVAEVEALHERWMQHVAGSA